MTDPRHCFPDQYMDLIFQLVGGPVHTETNARTGAGIRAIPHPVHLLIDLRGGLMLPGNRAYFPHIAAAEVAWMLKGTRDPDFIMKHAPKLWGKFIEDGKLRTAYGYRWRWHFGRDQLGLAVAALQADPTNRQCWVQAWDPSCDGLGTPGQPKNIPCPVGFTINVIKGRLNLSVFIRSSDVYVGLPYDVMGYAILASLIANELGVEVGHLSVTLAHAHLYDVHLDLAKEDLSRVWNPDRMAFSSLTISEAERHAPLLVDYYKAQKPNPHLPRKLPELIE